MTEQAQGWETKIVNIHGVKEFGSEWQYFQYEMKIKNNGTTHI